MLFWFTKTVSLLSFVWSQIQTLQFGEGEKINKTNKPNPRRREQHWRVLSGIQAICPRPFPLSHFLWCSGIEDHLKVLLWDPNDTPPSCLLSPGLSGTLALAHTHKHTHTYTHPPSPSSNVLRSHGTLGVSVMCRRWLLRLEEFSNFLVAHELAWLLWLIIFFLKKKFFFLLLFSLFLFPERQISDESGVPNKLNCHLAGSVGRGQV